MGVMELLLDRTKFYVFGGNVTSASRILGKFLFPLPKYMITFRKKYPMLKPKNKELT